MDFTGKTAIVTGAGKGIGRETVRSLTNAGASVVAISRTGADLDSLHSETGCRAVVADLADAAAARAAALEALPADFLINCAGLNVLEPFLEMQDASFDLVQAVNVRAALIVAQEFARDRVKRREPGAIVNVSSMSSLIGFADHAAYCASKGALDAASRVMANELGPHGIRVNCINPIITMTELAAKAWSDPEKSAPVLARMPVGRFAEVDDVASVILFLLSDAAAMMNGLAIPIDGGFLTR